MSSAIQATSRRLTAEQRRGQLVAVALELFAHRGYRATTMDDIAERAGVTKPLLYQHFSSKRALYLELVDSIAQDLLTAIRRAVMRAEGPRQQVELGFAAYFALVISNEAEFRLLYGRDHADDFELGRALRAVEDAIAEAIDPLIDAGLDDDHRRLLAYGIVGMAEGASRRFMAQRPDTDAEADEEAQRLARRMADLAWAGLRSVHAD
ncbi:MAG TPA: TetR/AcrR family transcriptional regulator [Acidimicrobiales bacterium]|jgi:AcrR family transcriptional regulator|nr:TetR/AcrR family transcriptional regulator [Acidimicrobiales bacterium]